MLVSVLIVGVIAKLLLRVVEVPLHGASRPWSGWITVVVCRIALWILRLPVTTNGKPMQMAGVYVANHSSWLDIFVLNAAAPLYFVSKSEVADWPGIGWLARITDTVFVRRSAREAGQQRNLLENRILAGHRLLIFPEGTSTDGQRVLTFKSTLFAALYSDRLVGMSVQPVTVVYRAPESVDARLFGWWGDMDFGPHLLQVLAAPGGGHVEVTWHKPLAVSDYPDRKALAATAEARVRGAHPRGEKAA
jgi:1-acyl-sn-glycerol-3-phosphate acyltransferase